MVNIEKLFQFYLDNQSELVKKYDGRYLVITEDGVVSDFPTQAEAYLDGVEEYGLGNFIIQLCTQGNDAYTQHFFSQRVSFV